MIDSNLKEAIYEKFQIEEDSKGIDADRALKIMAAICWSYSCTQNDFQLYEVYNKDDLIDSIIGHATELADNDDYIYTKVREIFGCMEDYD
jgi:hypothetical protein